jgi:putative ABC transport system permease protein
VRRVRAWFSRFVGLFGHARRERELAAELESHLALHMDDNLRAGMTAQEARREALMRLGGMEQTKELYRERRGILFVETLWQDMRYGLRMLRRAPGFALIAVLTMALGIGANTALFSVVNAVLINPLPYKQSDRLVAMYMSTSDSSKFAISYPNFLDWERDNRVFSAMAAFRFDVYDLTGMGEPELLRVEMVSASFFPMLGVKPVLGRQFTAGEDQLGGTPVALLSEGFWERKFGGARDVVGKTITLNDRVRTIVGVVPASFHYSNAAFDNKAEVYLPIGQWREHTFWDRRDPKKMDAVARLKAGVTLAQAQANMNAIAAHLAQQYPNADKGTGVTLLPLKQDVVGNIRPFLLLLLGAVGFVLLIACVNVANLLLARSTARTREFAVRAALGASKGRMIRQLLAESLLLAFAGGALGLALAAWGTQAALGLLPEALPRASEVHLGGAVLFFTLGMCVVAGLVFGIVPALKSSGADIQETLKEGGRGSSGTRHRTQRIFVATEMALAVVLLVGAGLMIRSLSKLWSVDPGYDPHHVMHFVLSVAQPLGTTTDVVNAAYRQIRERIESVPGIEAASLTAGATPIARGSQLPFWLEGEAKPATEAAMKTTLLYAVQEDYRKVMRIPLVRGRFLTPQDDAHSATVCVIDEQFARLYFGNRDPIGQRVNLDLIDMSPEIVGIVGHVKQWGLASDARSPIQAQIYIANSQVPSKFVSLENRGSAIVVRTDGPPLAEVSAIRHALEKLNGNLIVSDVQTMDGIIAHSLAARRFAMILLGVFAGIALVLACVGIYGVVAYLVGQRTHEIGIRTALGAQREDVLRLVLGEGARMALLGVGVGLAAALGLARLMAGMIFGVSAHDPVTFAAVCGLLVLVALLATYIPARRAARIDPVIALRQG